MKAFLRCSKWTPKAKAKATVRFVARAPLPGLTTRIEAAKLTALRFRGLADIAGASSVHRERMLASAKAWDAKVDELLRLQRGKQTLTITLP